MEKKKKLGVFLSEKQNASDIPDWTFLPATSEYLINLQFVPDLGDRIAIYGTDSTEVLGRTGTDFRNIVTVKDRLINYSLCEIAIIVHYEPF